MTGFLGLAVFALGIALLIVALDTVGVSGSVMSQLGGISAPDSPWLLAGGTGAIILGLMLAFRNSRGK